MQAHILCVGVYVVAVCAWVGVHARANVSSWMVVWVVWMLWLLCDSMDCHGWSNAYVHVFALVIGCGFACEDAYVRHACMGGLDMVRIMWFLWMVEYGE